MAPLKIQPIDIDSEKATTELVRNEPVSKWRLKRFFAFEKPFPKNNTTKDGAGGVAELEPSSVCLAKMVQSFMEEQPQPQLQPPSRNRCNCFNANSSDEDDFDFNGYTHQSVTDSTDSLKVKRLEPKSKFNFIISILIIVFYLDFGFLFL